MNGSGVYVGMQNGSLLSMNFHCYYQLVSKKMCITHDGMNSNAQKSMRVSFG